MTFSTKDITRIAVVASIYVALSLAIAPLSFGQIQFRFAEMLVLLVVFNRKYAISLVLGCFIVNIFSPLGIIDMLVGTGATLVTCIVMMFIRNLYVASLIPTLFCIIVGAELHFVTGAPFWLTSFTVMAGEFVVVSLIGCPLMKIVLRNRALVNMLGLNRNLPRNKVASEPPPYKENELEFNSQIEEPETSGNVEEMHGNSQDGNSKEVEDIKNTEKADNADGNAKLDR